MKRRTLEEITALDRDDPLREKRSAFEIPEDVIYLDGNSLGVLPKAVPALMDTVVTQQWGDSLIRGWSEHGWMDLPSRVGNKIGRLIGAQPGTVIVADSTSVNLFKLLAAALALRPRRKVILSDSGNFPTDLHIAQGLRDLLERNHELRLVAPDKIEGAIDESVAVLMLTEVDYKTGFKHDMARLTGSAHNAGALTLWDLAHSAGAFPVDLTAAKVDFAVGCGYKYLNGGPGAPAFLYIAPEHQNKVMPPLSGWMGHQAPFDFDLEYRPAAGIECMRVGTPPVLSLSALDCALDVYADVDMLDIRQKSVALCELFISEVEARCAELQLASPRNADARGSQVSFRYDYGCSLIKALSVRGVIGDFRPPDIIRFGFTPLYHSYMDVFRAAEILEETIPTGYHIQSNKGRS